MTALTTERLDEIEQDPIEACLTDDEIIELVSAARANVKLVEALKETRGLIRAITAADDAIAIAALQTSAASLAAARIEVELGDNL